MVEAVRRGRSMRQVARDFRVALAVVQHWLKRAQGQRLDRVDWENRPSGPREPRHKTSPTEEDRILAIRKELREASDLGEYGAEAIWLARKEQGEPSPPSVRTIGRILERRGALDGHRRVRWPSPPRGWYLPGVGAGRAEVDSCDIIEGLHLQGGQPVEVLTAISLQGGLAAAWPSDGITAKNVVAALLEHWRAQGLPAYAQFDNDTPFQGPHHHPDTFGRVTRLCLRLGVIPVFTPMGEPGFQAAIENFNGRWQAKVWARFRFPGLAELQAQSAKFIAASRVRAAARIDSAPTRRSFPVDFQLDLQAELRGKMLFLRRTDEAGGITMLGHAFPVHPHWPHRLVRAEVNLNRHRIVFHALSRREPTQARLLTEIEYHWPNTRFRE